MVPAPEEMAQHARRGPRPLTRAASREWPQPPGSGLPWGMSGLLRAQRGLGGARGSVAPSPHRCSSQPAAEQTGCGERTRQPRALSSPRAEPHADRHLSPHTCSDHPSGRRPHPRPSRSSVVQTCCAQDSASPSHPAARAPHLQCRQCDHRQLYNARAGCVPGCAPSPGRPAPPGQAGNSIRGWKGLR